MIEEKEVMKCVWDTFTECRHEAWFEHAQEYLNASKLSIVGIVTETENQFDRLKEGCKICLFADLNRNLRLLSVRGQ